MKKLIFTSLLAILMLSSFKNGHLNSIKINDGLENLYKHLGKNIKYPEAAKADHIQGNSLILFTVNTGKLSGIKVETELGSDCDTEVLKKLLAYEDLKSIKNGNYALKTTFKLDGSTSEVKNAKIKVPADYIELALTIVAFAPPINKVGSAIKIKQSLKHETEVSLQSSNIRKLKNYKIVLDGKTIDTAAYKTIKPEDIYSVTILKDATTTAFADKEGVDGTINITTKKAALKN